MCASLKMLKVRQRNPAPGFLDDVSLYTGKFGAYVADKSPLSDLSKRWERRG